MGDDKIFEFTFKNNEFLVSINEDETDKLIIELTDKLNGDKWKGIYESSYIEDLTRKTGNFKQFTIFIHMLETALSKSSESVTIDLYTYSDLEQLRNKKTNNSNASLSSKSSSAITNNKRYIILTYNVEFDRIHYPLQLNYLGKVDVDLIQQKHTKQSHFIPQQQSTNNGQEFQKQLLKLQRENELLHKDKDKIEIELIECKNELKSRETNDNMVKEIKVLKQMIKSIEEESLKEKNMLQKQLQKKTKECSHLIEECEELKASERNLKHQIKSLQSELALYRRNRVFNSNSSNQFDNTLKNRSRDSSKERTFRSNSRDSFRQPSSASSRQRSASRENNNLLHQVADGLRKTRSRSNSYDGLRIRSKNPSPANSIRSHGSNGSQSSRPRFNPTEYVKDKNRKLEENELKKKRQLVKTMNSGTLVKTARTPSISSITSALDSDNDSNFSYARNRSSSRNRSKKVYDYDSDYKISTTSSTPNTNLSKTKKNRSSKTLLNDDYDSLPYSGKTYDNNSDENDRYSRENEMKELDARLKSLKLFMTMSQPYNKKSNKKSNKDSESPRKSTKQEADKNIDKSKDKHHIRHNYHKKELPRNFTETPKQQESSIISQNKSSDDEQDRKSYRRRELVSNWSKYEITENISESEGVAFDELLEASTQQTKYLKDEKATKDLFDIDSSFKLDLKLDANENIFSINITKLNDAYECIPFNKMFLDTLGNDYAKKYLGDDLLRHYEMIADESLERFSKKYSVERQDIQNYVTSNEELKFDEIEALKNSNLTKEKLHIEEKKSEKNTTELDLENLLALSNTVLNKQEQIEQEKKDHSNQEVKSYVSSINDWLDDVLID